MSKILLFYKYIAIKNPQRMADWLRTICLQLNLKGRIILAHEGINATIGGSEEMINAYKIIMHEHPLFGNIDFKESIGNSDCFPRLSIKIKKEIVNFGIDPETLTPEQGGIHLSPKQVHDLLENKPKDLVVLDTRNKMESAIGTFQDAIKADINYFRELPGYIDATIDQFKDKQVLMFCTGGVRCERATAYLHVKGVAKSVYQLEGGIHRYIEQYPDGYFRGKNYVFDGRISVAANTDILTTCTHCNKPWDEYINCLNASCNKHTISCPACAESLNDACSKQCQTLLAEHKVQARPAFKKVTIETIQQQSCKNKR